jgi:hypothetical protein
MPGTAARVLASGEASNRRQAAAKSGGGSPPPAPNLAAGEVGWLTMRRQRCLAVYQVQIRRAWRNWSQSHQPGCLLGQAVFTLSKRQAEPEPGLAAVRWAC